jgi:predicted nucleic acid-binding protein
MIPLERGEIQVGDVLGADEDLVSVITVSELLYGIFRARSPVRIRRRQLTEKLLQLFAVEPITEEVARIHAELDAELVSDGLTVSANDLWIGCTALAGGYGVVTRDRRSFSRIPGLRVITA